MTRHLGPHDHVITLADGRSLGYAEYGAADGTPLLYNHGGLSSRLDIEHADATARELGIRIIAPDRPGVGISDSRPGRVLTDWPDDVTELVDSLGIDRFAVLGWSLGGQFAMVTGWAMPDRVTIVGLVASAIPGDWPGMADTINRMDHFFMEEAASSPWVDRAGFIAMRTAAAVSPELFARASSSSMDPASERAIEGNPRGFADATRQGLASSAGVVDEYRVLQAPYGFDLADLTVPVHLWQGTDDRLVPATWAGRLAERIPNSTVTMIPGQGHFLLVEECRTVLQTLVDV